MQQALIIALSYPYGYCEVGQRFYALDLNQSEHWWFMRSESDAATMV